MYNYAEITDEEVELQHKELLKICTIKDESLEFEDHYGLGFWLRKYANFPTWLPLYFHGDHGPSLSESILKYELNSKFSKALFHNKLKIKDAINKKFKKAYIVGSGFVHYKNINGIKRASKLEGTICFPYHSTVSIDVTLDWNLYIDDLLKLPEKFHPITVCVHFVDIEKGLDNFFLKRGLSVVTAGHKKNKKFIENFYQIIKGKKYATSNILGSQAFYCSNLGVPFFLYGNNDVIIQNNNNISFINGSQKLMEFIHNSRKMDVFDKATTIYSEFNEEVTEEQLKLSDLVLGVNDAISSKMLNRILWVEFFLNFHNFILSKLNIFISNIYTFWKWNIRIRIKKKLRL